MQNGPNLLNHKNAEHRRRSHLGTRIIELSPTNLIGLPL